MAGRKTTTEKSTNEYIVMMPFAWDGKQYETGDNFVPGDGYKLDAAYGELRAAVRRHGTPKYGVAFTFSVGDERRRVVLPVMPKDIK